VRNCGGKRLQRLLQAQTLLGLCDLWRRTPSAPLLPPYSRTASFLTPTQDIFSKKNNFNFTPITNRNYEVTPAPEHIESWLHNINTATPETRNRIIDEHFTDDSPDTKISKLHGNFYPYEEDVTHANRLSGQLHHDTLQANRSIDTTDLRSEMAAAAAAVTAAATAAAVEQRRLLNIEKDRQRMEERAARNMADAEGKMKVPPAMNQFDTDRLNYREPPKAYADEETDSETQEVERPASAPPVQETGRTKTPTKAQDNSVRPKESIKSMPTLVDLNKPGNISSTRQINNSDYEQMARNMMELKNKQDEQSRINYDQSRIIDDLKRTQYAQNERKRRLDEEKSRKMHENMRNYEENNRDWVPGRMGHRRSRSQPSRRHRHEEEENDEATDEEERADDEDEGDEDEYYEPPGGRGRPTNRTHRNSGGSEGKQGLWRSVRHIANAIGNLNRINRDANDSRQDTEAHVSALTRDKVEDNLDYSMKRIFSQIDEKITQAVSRNTERMRIEFTSNMENKFESRLTQVEVNERLSSRINTEKKDPLKAFAAHPLQRADEEAVRKANVAMRLTVVQCNATVSFHTDPFNWIGYICEDSNRIAAVHQLNESQHMSLIVSTIPYGSIRDYINISSTVGTLFSTVSTMSSNQHSQTDLENKINLWRIDNRDKTRMFVSICELYSLINKNREDFATKSPHPPTIFRQMIAQIQKQTDLPPIIREALNTARLRIRDSDPENELNITLLSACNKYVGWRGSGSKTTVKAITYNKSTVPAQTAPPDTTADPPGMSSRPPQTKPAKKEFRMKMKMNDDEEEDESSTDDARQSYQNRNRLRRQNSGMTNYKGRKFVRPYPDKPYLNRAGNGLSKDFEEWFKGYCVKCGHFSHEMADCKTYPEKSTCLSLCCVCRQGMHDVCRSKRGDLVEKYANSQQVKKLEQKYDYVCDQLALLQPHHVYPQNDDHPPAKGKAKQPMAYTGTDDEEN